MARQKGSREIEPAGVAGRMKRRLGRQPGPGEGQVILAAFALATVALVLAPAVTTDVPDQTGKKAAEFSLETSTGGTYHFAPSALGRPAMLEFMHPLCSHCQAMTGRLTSAYNTFGAQVEFLSIAIPLAGFADQTVQDVENFKESHSHTWTYLYSPDVSLSQTYGVTGTPTFFFVSVNGTIRYAQAGEMTAEALAQNLQSLVVG